MSHLPTAQDSWRPSSTKWQELISLHLDTLKDHLSLWNSVKDVYPPGSKACTVAQECIDRTKAMVASFELSSSFLDYGNLAQSTAMPVEQPTASTKLDSKPDSKPVSSLSDSLKEQLSFQPSKKRHREDDTRETHKINPGSTIADEGCLFTIDLNPTPIEQLLQEKSQQNGQQRSPKRPKESPHRGQTQTTSSPRTAQHAPPEIVPEGLENHPSTTLPIPPLGEIGIEGDDESFLAKVKKRHQEKEEQRKKKRDKKRKRDSHTSVESVDQYGAQSKVEKQKRKKVKRHELNNGDSRTKESKKSDVGSKDVKRTSSNRDRDKRRKKR